MSILQKIQNPIKFEPLLRFQLHLKTKVCLQFSSLSNILSIIMNNYLAQNLNYSELEAKPFLNNSKFHKIWTLRWIISQIQSQTFLNIDLLKKMV